jgi:outer membrane biosynthesis protein TonB
VKIVKSLDPVNGLDQEAIRAVKGWLFQPATLRATGQPIDYQATVVLSFRIF